jgi:hypothetical protein
MAEAGDPVERDPGGRRVAWPWYVRWRAVAYVLSRIAGPVGFLVLGGVAAALAARHGLTPDWGVGAAVAAALAWPAGCAAFRWRFRRWGQRRWPAAEPNGAPNTGREIG